MFEGSPRSNVAPYSREINIVRTYVDHKSVKTQIKWAPLSSGAIWRHKLKFGKYLTICLAPLTTQVAGNEIIV